MNYLRLKKNSDFQKLFNNGKRVYSSSITMLYYPSKKLTMGIAISKKHGKATKRNKIKRLIRAAFNDNCLLLSFPCNIIIMPRVLNDYSYKDFVKNINYCFGKIKP